jgi:hypothetical protein
MPPSAARVAPSAGAAASAEAAAKSVAPCRRLLELLTNLTQPSLERGTQRLYGEEMLCGGGSQDAAAAEKLAR